VLGASALTAIVASLCCILPLLAALLGLSGVAAASAFAKWRPVFLLATVVLLGLGWYLTYRKPKEACTEGAACATKPVAKWNKVVLWAATAMVVIMATFPIYSGAIARWTQSSSPPAAGQTSADTATLKVKIPSMDCDACAAGIQAVLQRQSGVQRAQVSFATKEAVVQYNAQKTSKEKLIAAIDQTGFKAE
jgi:mercuric ion transport protein